MAVHCATSADYLSRTTVIASGSDHTAMVWAKQDVAPTGIQVNTYQIFIDATPATYTHDVGWYTVAGPLDLADITDGGVGGSFSQASPAAGTYRHYAYTYTAATHTYRFYVNGTLVNTTVSTPTMVVAFALLCGDSTSLGGVSAAYAREWSAVLTQAQIRNELASSVVVHTTNLFVNTPLTSDLLDISGNGRNWTQNGAGTFVASPTLQPNVDATTAITLPSLPFDLTVTRSSPEVSVNPNLWYTYTGVADDVVIGLWPFTSLASTQKPDIVCFTGPASAPVAYVVDVNSLSNVPYSIPVTPGLQLFFKVEGAGVDVPGVPNFTLSGRPQPTQTVAVGDLLVNDETDDFPVVILNPTTGETKRHYVFASGESADTLPNGRVLADNINTNGGSPDLQLWDTSVTPFALVGSVPYPANFSETYHVYASDQGNYWATGKFTTTTTTLVKFSSAGAVLATFTLTHTNNLGRPIGFAVSPDESICYYAVSGIANAAVQRWDLVNNIALSNLVAGVANYQVQQDILCLTDGTVLTPYFKGTVVRDTNVKHYSAAGATLNTYTFSGGPNLNVNRMCRALDNPISFWVWLYTLAPSTTDGTNRYVNVRVSDGASLVDFTVTQFERGNYAATPTATPTARFGPSFSCPMWIYPVSAPTPIGGPVEYLIRRERWFPHLSQEQFRQFFSMLQIDLQAGNGLGNVDSTTQGFNPLLEIDWSDDGGWTWSSIRFVETGKVGAYTQRAIVRRLGYSRDRVFRIACSDPNQWIIVNGYVQAVLGTS